MNVLRNLSFYLFGHKDYLAMKTFVSFCANVRLILGEGFLFWSNHVTAETYSKLASCCIIRCAWHYLSLFDYQIMMRRECVILAEAGKGLRRKCFKRLVDFGAEKITDANKLLGHVGQQDVCFAQT